MRSGILWTKTPMKIVAYLNKWSRMKKTLIQIIESLTEGLTTWENAIANNKIIKMSFETENKCSPKTFPKAVWGQTEVNY